MNPYDDLFRNPTKYLAYSGEAILSQRDLEANSVGFYLELDPDGHPFGRFKAGPLEHGDRFYVVAFQIGDDGEPLNQDMRLHLKRALGSSIRKANRNRWVQAAGALCKSKPFHNFLKVWIKRLPPQAKGEFAAELPLKLKGAGLETLDGPMAEEFATNFLRYHCKIRSRSELGQNAEATERFRQLREQYYAFLFDQANGSNDG